MPDAPQQSRRDEILRVATELFARHGYHAVGMRAIADAVGIRGSSLYNHFASKGEILHAVARDYMREFIDEKVTVLAGEGPPQERLQSVLRAQIIYFWAHREQRAVGLRELRQLDEDAYRALNEDRLRYQHAVRSVIEEGAAAGIFAVEDPAVATFATLGMVTTVNDWFHEGGTRTIEEVADAYAALAVERLLGGDGLSSRRSSSSRSRA